MEDPAPGGTPGRVQERGVAAGQGRLGHVLAPDLDLPGDAQRVRVGGDMRDQVPAGPAGQQARTGIVLVVVRVTHSGDRIEKELGTLRAPAAGVLEGAVHGFTTRLVHEPMPSTSVTTVSPPTR